MLDGVHLNNKVALNNCGSPAFNKPRRVWTYLNNKVGIKYPRGGNKIVRVMKGDKQEELSPLLDWW